MLYNFIILTRAGHLDAFFFHYLLAYTGIVHNTRSRIYIFMKEMINDCSAIFSHIPRRGCPLRTRLHIGRTLPAVSLAPLSCHIVSLIC
jgi:hypothetical protein